ncbi:MAG: YbbR-like domain-containing protein [Alphaproteobacteria bacterium]
MSTPDDRARERERSRVSANADSRRLAGRPTPSKWADLGLWALSLATAFGLWFFVNTGDGTEDRTMRVRLEPANLPPGLVVTNALTEHVELRVSGPSVIVAGIDARRLKGVVDLSNAQPPRVRENLGESNFSLPRKVQVKKVVPSWAIFDVDRLASRTLPIRLDRRGETRPGQRIGGIEIVPDRVEVVGPEQAVLAMKDVPTKPIDVSTLEEGAQVEVDLEAGSGAVRFRPARVIVRFDVETLHEVRRLTGIPVRAGDGGSWVTSPASVAVVVRGPGESLQGLELDDGSVYVDVDGHVPGTAFRARPRVRLPDDVEVVRIEPEEVSVQPARSGAGGARVERRQ